MTSALEIGLRCGFSLRLTLCSQVTVSGMHTRRQSLLLGDTPAQISQLHPFFFTEGGAKALVVFGSNPGELTEHLVSARREMQRVITAILRAPPTLDDAFGLEIIDQQHHAARHHPEMICQYLLTDARIGRKLPEQPRIRSRQPNLCHAFAKTTRPMSAHLG